MHHELLLKGTKLETAFLILASNAINVFVLFLLAVFFSCNDTVKKQKKTGSAFKIFYMTQG